MNCSLVPGLFTVTGMHVIAVKFTRTMITTSLQYLKEVGQCATITWAPKERWKDQQAATHQTPDRLTSSVTHCRRRRGHLITVQFVFSSNCLVPSGSVVSSLCSFVGCPLHGARGEHDLLLGRRWRNREHAGTHLELPRSNAQEGPAVAW